MIVRYRQNQDCEKSPPYAEAIEDGAEYAAGVELCNHVGDLCVRRGRDEARVGCHVGSEDYLAQAMVGSVLQAREVAEEEDVCRPAVLAIAD